MNSSDITNTVIIIIIFATINLVSVLGTGIEHIKANWNDYKCMPIIIPFARYFGHDPDKTFDTCIQSVTSNFIGDILNPIYDIFKEVSSVGIQLGGFMSMFNTIGGSFKSNFLDMLLGVYDTGSKLVLGLMQIAITIQDMINKLMGIFVIIIYILLGANYTVVSIWTGLPGGIVRTATSIAG